MFENHPLSLTIMTLEALVNTFLHLGACIYIKSGCSIIELVVRGDVHQTKPV